MHYKATFANKSDVASESAGISSIEKQEYLDEMGLADTDHEFQIVINSNRAVLDSLNKNYSQK